MNQWYTLYAKPNAEYQVERTLQQHGIETFIPELTTFNKDQQPQKEPLFPCYLFIRADLKDINPSLLKWTPGLRYVVAFDSRPTPVSDEMLALIKRKLKSLNKNGERWVSQFEPGETVRITEGPFRDMLAIFERPTSPNQRVQVLLSFLGRASRVQLDESSLKKAPPNANVPGFNKRPRRTRGRGRRIKN